MPFSTPDSVATFLNPDDLTARLERVVHARTGGRIRDLRIDLFDDQVVVAGVVPTYYTKQLVTHAVLEEIKDRELSNVVHVE